MNLNFELLHFIAQASCIKITCNFSLKKKKLLLAK